MPDIQQSSRYLAMETLDRIEKNQAYSHLLINETIKNNDLSQEDANLYTELVYGTTQRKLTLDYYIDRYLKKGQRLDSWLRQLLRLSIYQYAYLDRIPDHAIVNEAVEIAKKRGHKGTASVTNAILRNLLRDGLPSLEEIADKQTYLSVKYSMPVELVNKFVNNLGVEQAEEMMASVLDHPHTSVRVNTRYLNREAAKEILESEGFEVRESQVSPDGLLINKGYIPESQLFREGKITIQDETSMLVGNVMNPEKGDFILDACAAPGGKTTHMANSLEAGAGGRIIAIDLHENKIRLIEENAERQGFDDLIQTRAYDAKKLGQLFDEETFDRILVDAPCSGLGLMRRKPDIKYTKTGEDFLRLKKIQLEILESVAPLLKKDGLLVYSTCTIIREENEEVIEEFLQNNEEFSKEEPNIKMSVVNPNEDEYIKVLPHEYHSDGFFIAMLKKD